MVATKLVGWSVKSRADMDSVLSEQLANLRTDYVDCYMLHGIDARAWARFKELGALDFLAAAKADGRIRYAGFSFHDEAAAFAPIVDAYDWDFCQIQYNYMDVECQAGRAGLRYAVERGLGVIVMEPIKGGRLADPVPDEVQAHLGRGSGREDSGGVGAAFRLGRPRRQPGAVGHEHHGASGRERPRSRKTPMPVRSARSISTSSRR